MSHSEPGVWAPAGAQLVQRPRGRAAWRVGAEAQGEEGEPWHPRPA